VISALTKFLYSSMNMLDLMFQELHILNSMVLSSLYFNEKQNLSEQIVCQFL